MSNQTKTVEEFEEKLHEIIVTVEVPSHKDWGSKENMSLYDFQNHGDEDVQGMVLFEKLKTLYSSEIKTAERELIKDILKLPTHPNGYAQERTIKPSDIKRLAEERGITIE